MYSIAIQGITIREKYFEKEKLKFSVKAIRQRNDIDTQDKSQFFKKRKRYYWSFAVLILGAFIGTVILKLIEKI